MAEIWKSTSSFSYGSHCEKATAALEQTEIYIFQPQQHIKRPIMAEIAATNCRSVRAERSECTIDPENRIAIPGNIAVDISPPYKNTNGSLIRAYHWYSEIFKSCSTGR